jgi:flagellar biosynthetic protein FliQ
VNPDSLAALTHESLRVLATVGAPLFGVVLGVGLLVGILQSATQINDSAVGFLPKIFAALLTMSLLGPWMVQRLSQLFILALNHLASGG